MNIITIKRTPLAASRVKTISPCIVSTYGP